MSSKANNPNKGFIKEISKPRVTSKPVKAFDYSKPLVKVPETQSMATPYRMKEMKQVKSSKSQMTTEASQFIQKQKEEKWK